MVVVRIISIVLKLLGAIGTIETIRTICLIRCILHRLKRFGTTQMFRAIILQLGFNDVVLFAFFSHFHVKFSEVLEISTCDIDIT